MAVLQDIEKRIEELSPSMFQQLGDAYLLSKNRNQYSAFLRNGSMLGKDKTIKGTPDTLAFMSDNKYLLIEYSTNSTDRANKLIDDIDKCIKKYEAKISQIEDIILFANYKLDEEEIVEIKEYASSMMVKCNIYGGGTLAMDILTNHPHLISTHLDIPVDTGQVVSLETFLREYQRKSAEIATPLDNPFLFRETELTSVIGCLNDSDIVILKGSPGVGKTKLALESIGRYQKEHPSYSCFAISYKDADLLTDLAQNIHADADCILFVDDANTVGHFKQVLGFYKKHRKGCTKLLITVRDYALGTIRDWCYPYQPKEVLVETFNADKIEGIVAATYGINDQAYLDTICRLSNGNPRIAMMLAKLTTEKQSIQSLNNVAQVFDLYFANIYNNEKLTKDILKVAGLIAFFQYIDYRNAPNLLERIIPFGINRNDFYDAINVLSELEIVDIPLEGYVKIGEQNLSTYIVYRVFIKDKLLSVDILLSLMSERNVRLFREKVISIDVAFDRDRVSGIVRPALLRYIKNHSDEDLIYVYNNFWVYLIDESLQFAHHHISGVAASGEGDYDFCYEENHFALGTNKDPYLELLSLLWRYSGKRFDMTLCLTLEYVEKCKSLAPQLAYHIKKVFNVTYWDYSLGYDLQKKLIAYIEKNIKKNKLCKALLWPVAQLLTQFSFRYDDPVEKYSFRLCTIQPKDDEWKDEIRKRIWKLISSHYTEQFLDFMDKYTTSPVEVVPEVAAYDMLYIDVLISSHLSPKNFDHCICVQNYVRWAKRNNIINEHLSTFGKRFYSDDYAFYVRLRRDYLRDREECDVDDIEDYELFKKKELKENFVFENEKSAKSFIKRYTSLYDHKISNKETLQHSLMMVIDINLTVNESIGFFLLRNILRKNMAGTQSYYIYGHLSDEEKAVKIWSYIRKHSFTHKAEWVLQYLHSVPEGYVKKGHFSYLAECLEQTENGISIFWNGLLRHQYLTGKPLDSLLQRIYNLNDKGKRIEFRGYQMVSLSQRVTDSVILFKSYIQQCEINGYRDFDYKKELLTALVKQSPSFILLFVSSSIQYWDSYEHGTISNLQFVWRIQGHPELMEKVFDYLLSVSPYMYDKYFDYSHAFFSDLKEEAEKKEATRFLTSYYKNNGNNYKAIDFVVYVAKRYFHNLYKELMIDYVVSHNETDFFRIDWFGNRGHYTTSGDITHYDVIVRQWTSVLEIIEDVDNIKTLAVISQIKEIVSDSKERADKERAKRRLYE